MSVMNTDYTIAEAFQSYLHTNSLRKTLSSQQIDRRVLAIARYFFEQMLGLALMSEVGLESLERFELWASAPHECGDIAKPAWSQSSIQRHCKTLKTIFKKAAATGRIPRNPCELWKIAAAEDFAGRRPMAPDEFEKILEAAPDWARPVFLFLRLTGQRPSSVARLRWGDIDEPSGVLYFTSRKGAAKREKRNAFPLTPEIRQLLDTIPPTANPNNSEADLRVFCKDNEPIDGPMISMCAHKIIKRLGFKDLCIYSLRHMFITELIESGVPNEVTRRLAGHANESMIQKYSKHLGMKTLENAVTMIRGKK